MLAMTGRGGIETRRSEMAARRDMAFYHTAIGTLLRIEVMSVERLGVVMPPRAGAAPASTGLTSLRRKHSRLA